MSHSELPSPAAPRPPLVSVCRRAALGRVLAVIAIACAASVFQLVIARSAHAAGPTVVSLAFDDSNEDQYTNALPALQAHHMVGTFYTITGYANHFSNYLTLPQLQQIYAAGNEIGAHTVLHPTNMAQLTADEQVREICASRNTLLSWGFPVTDFAYPHSIHNSQLEQEVAHCGLNSARYDGDLKSPDGCFTGCPVAETIPPANPYAVRAPDAVTNQWSLQDLESIVTQAENNGGGWAFMVFHHICDNNCDLYSVSPALFNQFLDWLQSQPVSVETVHQVIGGPVQPAVSAPSVPPAPIGQNGVTNASLETPDPFTTGLPYCWQHSTTGTNDAAFSLTSNAHSGSVASQIAVNNFTSGAARLITRQDLGQCAPSLTAGDTYETRAYYQSSTPTRFVAWYRDTNGGWHYWTESPQFPASATWTQASWGLPTVPAGYTAVSFGLDIEGAGTLTTDDYSLVDVTGQNPSPVVALTSPADDSTASGSVSLAASVSSSIGISRVDYLVNGTTVASSTVPPFSATWDSTTAADGPVTVTARATDVVGQTTTSSPISVDIANAGSRGGNLLTNASLENNSSGGTTPNCWQQQSSGTNTAAWTYTPSAHTGNWAENLNISSYTSGSRALITSQRETMCSPRVTPGNVYHLSGWYNSTAQTRFVVYYLTPAGTWQYWTQSGWFAPANAWTQATWTTPPVPSGASALSIGLSLASTGSLTTDDYFVGS